jgi:serine/threonine protein kinase
MNSFSLEGKEAWGAGTLWGGYVIEALISRSSAFLYRAWDQERGERVALKVLPIDPEVSQEQVDRFKRESLAVQRLEHPHIVPIRSFGQEGAYVFMAMEWIEGISFLEFLEQEPLHPQCLPLFMQILETVAFVHERGILHRDLKPQNILVTGGAEKAYLLDFGLARWRGSDIKETTKEGISMGTPHFMSPEQARGEMKDLDERSDIYSLGAILYQILTGFPPFLGKTPLDILVKVITERPKTPRERNPRIPPKIEMICLKAMSPLKHQRYSSALLFLGELEHYQNTVKKPTEALRSKSQYWLNHPWIFLLFLLFCFFGGICYFFLLQNLHSV